MKWTRMTKTYPHKTICIYNNQYPCGDTSGIREIPLRRTLFNDMKVGEYREFDNKSKLYRFE
mgnify:CR=1 FL=1